MKSGSRAHAASLPAGSGRARGAASSRAKERLDQSLVRRGLAESREKAARLILAGAVTVDGRRVDKVGTMVGADVPIEVAASRRFVSRGGEKLDHAIGSFGLDVTGQVCMDVGASTGGFTHCLLERGAARVYAVDVGQGQLDARHRADGRVVVMERMNARQLTPAMLSEPPTIATMDVSFISLEKVLPAVFGLLARAGQVVALVKPQFEVGRGEVGKGGVVRRPEQHRDSIRRIARFCVLHGWHVLGVVASPIKGPKGNREFFLHISSAGRTRPDLDAQIERAAEEPPETPP